MGEKNKPPIDLIDRRQQFGKIIKLLKKVEHQLNKQIITLNTPIKTALPKEYPRWVNNLIL